MCENSPYPRWWIERTDDERREVVRRIVRDVVKREIVKREARRIVVRLTCNMDDFKDGFKKFGEADG